jgi:hypothetical protein
MFPKFKTQAEIPEAFRSMYVEKDGEWIYEDPTDGLRTSQRQLLDEKKKTEEQLKKIVGNRKPEDVAALLANADQAEEERQKKVGELDQIIDKRVKAREAELLPEVEAGRKALLDLAKRNFTDKVLDVAGEVGVNIQKHKRAFLRTVEEDMLKLEGDELVVLAPGGGKRNVSPKDFLEKEFKKDYPEFFFPSGGSGSGSSNQNINRGNQSGTGGVVDITDPNAFLANVDNIASGKQGTFAPPAR